MQQSGIYNAALFGASQRDARGKLDQMAGIKRPGPSGILASSTQLMNAAAPAMLPKQPMPMPMPQAMPAPAPMPMPQAMPTPQPMPTPQAAAGLPQVPMQTAVSARPSAPVPTVPQPASPLTPMKFEEGSMVDIGKQPVSRVMTNFLGGAPAWLVDSAKSVFGSEAAASEAAGAKLSSAQERITPDTSPAEAANVVLDLAGETPSDDSKRDFARSVLGIDTNNIDEIDDAIFNTLTADVSLSGSSLQQAVLLGLQNYKQTAAARAAAAADSKSGGGFLSTAQGEAALDLYLKRIENNESPSEVEQMMNDELGNNIGTKVRIAVAGSPPPTQQINPEDRLNLVKQALEQEPQNREAILKQAQKDGVNIEGL